MRVLQTWMRRLNAIRCRLQKGGLPGKEEIVAAGIPLERFTGVYFLIDEGEVVYVGQSRNVYARVAAHQSGKTFSSFYYIRCATEDLDLLESAYIHLLRPRMNGRVCNGTGEMLTPVKAKHLLTFDSITVGGCE